jgi:transcriptional regulator with XRE-family HTH domain
MDIGNAIKTIRKARKLTQEQMQKKSRISQTSLSQIEGGHKQPTKNSLARIAKALNVPVAAIYIVAMEPGDFPNQRAFKQTIPLLYVLAELDMLGIHPP